MDIEIFINNVCKLKELDVDKLMSSHKVEPYNIVRKSIIAVLRHREGLTQKSIAYEVNRTREAVCIALQVHENYMKFNKQYKEVYKSIYNVI